MLREMIKFKEEWRGYRPGEYAVITSPEAKELVAIGVAEYPDTRYRKYVEKSIRR